MADAVKLDPQLAHFVNAIASRETDVQRRLREVTAKMSNAQMQISPEEASMLQFLAISIGARRAIEIGTFTGYSALAVAMVLPADGKLIACDVSDEWTRIGKPFWKEAGVADRIDLRLAPAADTLQALLRDGQANAFDFAFIDADKVSYDTYYELVLQLLRPGGVAVLDNMLWSGRVADDPPKEPESKALRQLNLKIRDDNRVDASLVAMRDGVHLVRKRG